MIDTHAHLDSDSFNEDRADVIRNAFNSGIEYIIIPAIREPDYCNVLELANNYEKIYCGIGIHPHHALERNENSIVLISELTRNPKVVAIGETGLDYYYDFAPKQNQIEIFIEHLKVSKELNLPVIIHNRDADDDILRILENEQDGKLTGVLHCFSSSLETMKKAIELNFHISFTGNITFKKSSLSNVIEEVPFDRIMLETDSPYMAPVPLRGKRNEPSNIKYIAQKIAEIKSTTIEEVISMTSNTAKKLFRLGILAILFFFLSYTPNFSQVDEDQDETELDEESEDLYNPYQKNLGFGAVFGTNTIIETYFLDAGDKDISYDGIFTYGGKISYGLFDFMLVEASYMYAKNTKIEEENQYLVGPNIHHNIDLSLNFIPNPHSRINFFGTAGFSYFSNTYDQGGAKEKKNEQFGMNFGLGIIGNIDFKDYGLLNLVAEWRLNFPFDREQIPYRPNPSKVEDVIYPEVFTLFSIPRFSIVWYPPLW